MLAFVVGDLIAFGAPLNPTTTPDVYRIADLPGPRALSASLCEQRVYTPEGAFLDRFHRAFSFKSFGSSDSATVSSIASLLPPNLSGAAGIHEAFNYDPLQIADVERVRQLADVTLRPSLLNSMAVRYVLTEAPSPGTHLPTVQFGALSAHENRDGLPRAFVSYAAEVVESHERAWESIAADSFDPRRAVVLEGDASIGLAGQLWADPASIVASDGRAVVVQATAMAPGYLVLSDAFYPGWRAFVDGASAEVLRANYAFRAVRLEPGEHRVEFRYAPRSYLAGLAISAAALAGLFGLVLRCGAGVVVSRRRAAGRP